MAASRMPIRSILAAYAPASASTWSIHRQRFGSARVRDDAPRCSHQPFTSSVVKRWFQAAPVRGIEGDFHGSPLLDAIVSMTICKAQSRP